MYVTVIKSFICLPMMESDSRISRHLYPVSSRSVMNSPFNSISLIATLFSSPHRGYSALRYPKHHVNVLSMQFAFNLIITLDKLSEIIHTKTLDIWWHSPDCHPRRIGFLLFSKLIHNGIRESMKNEEGEEIPLKYSSLYPDIPKELIARA